MKRHLILLLAVALGSCNEEFRGMEDQQAPLIEILAPQNWEIEAGDTLRFKVKISDNDQLHDYYLGLNNLSKMTKEIHWSDHTHAQSILLDTLYVVPEDLPYSHFQLQIEASDHQANAIKRRYAIFIKAKQ